MATKILIPLDGSKTAEHSLAYLVALRHLPEPQILLLGVIDEAEDFRSLPPTEAEERAANVLATYLREVANDIEQHVGIAVETMVGRGTPAGSILEEAGRFAPDLLVISTHGRSGISRWRFGSVADKVIRGVECSTLVVGPKAAEREIWLEAEMSPAFRSILVPLDGSLLAEEALSVAQLFADQFSSELHLVRVVPMPLMGSGMVGDTVYKPETLDNFAREARDYVDRQAKRLKPGTPVRTDVLTGPAAARLEEYVIQNQVGLVVMTSHGRSGIVRTALGSVTDRLLGAGAPVLVVRTRAQ